MKRSKSFFDYIYFVRKWAQLSRLFYIAQTIPSNLNVSPRSRTNLRELNSQRMRIQALIGELNLSVQGCECASCPHPCCGGNYDHYRVIDYWLRLDTTNSIDGFGRQGFASFFSRLKYWFKLVGESPNRTGCPYLGRDGCILTVELRPIMCVSYTCGRYREAMPYEVRRHYAYLVRDLYSISLSVFCILKKETKRSTIRSRISLALTF